MQPNPLVLGCFIALFTRLSQSLSGRNKKLVQLVHYFAHGSSERSSSVVALGGIGDDKSVQYWHQGHAIGTHTTYCTQHGRCCLVASMSCIGLEKFMWQRLPCALGASCCSNSSVLLVNYLVCKSALIAK